MLAGSVFSIWASADEWRWLCDTIQSKKLTRSLTPTTIVDRDFRKLPPGKQLPALWVRARQNPLFTDVDYVRAKNISLWLSTMHGGSGSQSQHSIHMILKSRGYIFRFTGGNWGNHVKKNTEISTLWCVPTGLFWLCNAGMLYELTHWSGLRKSKPSLGQYRWISV